MLPWDLSDRERHAIVQYLKIFSPRWKEEPPGQRIVPDGPDPWDGHEADALELGKRLYHLTGARMSKTGQLEQIFAGCSTCHPAYLSKEELAALSRSPVSRRSTARISTAPSPRRPTTRWTSTSCPSFRRTFSSSA